MLEEATGWTQQPKVSALAEAEEKARKRGAAKRSKAKTAGLEKPKEKPDITETRESKERTVRKSNGRNAGTVISTKEEESALIVGMGF